MRLHDPLSTHLRLTPPQKEALSKLHITTVRDLLLHFPFRYEAGGASAQVAGLTLGAEASLVGTLEKLETKKSWKRRIPVSEGVLRDATGTIALRWFNQPYIAKMYTNGTHVQVTGKVTGSEGKLYIANPSLERVPIAESGIFEIQTDAGGTERSLFAVYPESRGITSLWARHAIEKILADAEVMDELVDPLPKEMLKRYNLPTLRTALVWIHTPERLKDAEAARKRFAFEEVFYIQLVRGRERAAQALEHSAIIETRRSDIESFMGDFPFAPTGAQQRAIDTVLSDFTRGRPMSRLLEGDVGSGKTAVAAASAYSVVASRAADGSPLQIAYMCPTEILATQHFESFIGYFAYLGIQVALLTGKGCRKFPSKINPKGWTDISRSQLLTWVANGEISIVIGTHALIQKTVKFKNLAYVIIDEQHRFGTKQRSELVRKEAAVKTGKTFGEKKPAMKTPLPHLLSMTATPIPRTLALTIYGDLDLTVLDQMPSGRKPIITEIVTPTHREHTYEKVRAELKAGRQAYVICPRIDEPDETKEAAVNAKSVKEEAKRLKAKVFKEYEIGILHSKMKPEEKEKVMLAFKAGKIHILCATSVVEVGVNVPNATVIIIEGGERFGLAQLHQLRGRVIRSNNQAYCYVFTGDGSTTHKPSEKTIERLHALTTAKNGFELAEYDLQFRGAGALAGGKQWGVSDIAMEALKNVKMVEAARTEARHVITASHTTHSITVPHETPDEIFARIFPSIFREYTRRKKEAVHFE